MLRWARHRKEWKSEGREGEVGGCSLVWSPERGMFGTDFAGISSQVIRFLSYFGRAWRLGIGQPLSLRHVY